MQSIRPEDHFNLWVQGVEDCRGRIRAPDAQEVVLHSSAEGVDRDSRSTTAVRVDEPYLRDPVAHVDQARDQAFESDPAKWYYLKAHYTDHNGKPADGYASAVGVNPSTSFWDYVVFGRGAPSAATLKFQLEKPDDQGWSRWNIRDNAYNDGYRLSCKATGWLYRASAYDVKFRVVDHKMYCNYRWDGPVGTEYRDLLVSAGQYLGMALPEFTCDLEATD